MSDLYEAISGVEKGILRAEENRRKIEKHVRDGKTHESHLEYANGLIAGMKSALITIASCRKDRIPEGDCRDIPV